MSNYLYNGIEFPALPEYDTAAYPCAVIVRLVDGDGNVSEKASLYVVGGEVAVTYDAGAIYLSHTKSIDYVSGNNWIEVSSNEYDTAVLLALDRPGGADDSGIATGAVTVWANIDIYNEDGTLYLAASEPVPVAGRSNMVITSTIKMELSRQGVPETVSIMQDDKYSRNIAFTLYENGVAWTPPSDATGVVRFLKPDGTGGNYDTLPDGMEAVTITDNILTVALAPQVCTAPGVVRLAVGLISGTAEINTFTVLINVHKNPGLQATSKGYYNVRGSLPDSGWEPNMYLGTDEDGKVVAIEAPAGGGGTDGLPMPASAKVGQYFRVSAVDESGRVTAVEAVDLDDKEASAYLYNGVELPALPEWDKQTYPYAYISVASGTHYFFCRETPRTVDATGGFTPIYNDYTHKLVDGVWEHFEGSAWGQTVIWANHDVYYIDSVEEVGGTLYLAASDPVPVYQKADNGGSSGLKEITLTTPISFDNDLIYLSAEENTMLAALAAQRSVFCAEISVEGGESSPGGVIKAVFAYAGMAGAGTYSSLLSVGGEMGAVVIASNDGKNWVMVGGAFG